MTLAHLAVLRTRTTLTLSVLIVLWGILSWVQLPKQAEPDVQIPFISVVTPVPGVAPDDIERLVTRPIEERVISDVDALVSMRSYSSLGISTLIAEFPAKFDQDKALRDVQQAVEDTKAKMPTDAEEAIVKSYNNSDFPLLRIGVLGESIPQRTLIAVAKRLQTELERNPNVREVNLSGAPDEIIEIIVDRLRMEAFGLPIQAVWSAVRDANQHVPAGFQDTGKGSFSIKVPSVLDSAEKLLNLPLYAEGERVILLKDVAEIRRGFKDLTSYSRINGQQGVSLEIVKQLKSNDIDTSDGVFETLEAFTPFLPGGVSISLIQDESAWARDMVRELQGNIGTSIWLVMALVVAALGFRAGLLVGLSIPFCFLGGFIVLNALGLAFNFMVMFGLLLSIGMLIDGAIVVVEHANRDIARGMEKQEAYLRSSRLMFWPITASAATTAAAFLPLILWPGVTGEFMKYLPITVFTVLGISLLYALVVVPVLGNLMGSPAQMKADPESFNELKLLHSPTVYRRMLDFLFNWPLTFLILVFLVLSFIVSTYLTRGPGSKYFVDVDEVYATANVKTLGNLSLEEKIAIADEVEQRILQFPEVRTSYLSVGSGGGDGNPFGGGRGTSDTIARFFIELHNAEDRPLQENGLPRSGEEIFNTIAESTSEISGIRVFVDELQSGPPAGKELEVEIQAPTRQMAWDAARKIRSYLHNHPTIEVARMEDTIPLPFIEWRLDIDRERASALNASLVDINALVQMTTTGVKIDEYLPDDSDDEVDILLRLPKYQRTIDEFSNLSVRTGPGQQIPFSSFIDVTPAEGYTSLRRHDGTFSVNLTADVPGEAVEGLISDVITWMTNGNLPPEVTLRTSGRAKELRETVEFLSTAGIVAMFLMLIMLVTQFNSYYQAIVTLSAVVMSVAGVFLMMLFTNRVMSVVMDGMGLVTLAGVVVNNNIVLIDTFNRKLRQFPHLSVRQAAIITAQLRLRPVILTTATTIFGLLPMVFGVSIDIFGRIIAEGTRAGQYWENLATTVASGLTVATVLTLVVTPVALTLPDYLRGVWRQLRGQEDGATRGQELAESAPTLSQ